MSDRSYMCIAALQTGPRNHGAYGGAVESKSLIQGQHLLVLPNEGR